MLTIEDVCTACHVKIHETSAYAFYITPSNHPIKRRVADVEAEGLKKKRDLLAARRLVLVLDLDQTVLHAALLSGYEGALNAEMEPKQSTTYTFELSDRSRMIVKFRPGLKEFLLQAHALYEIHVYTMANAEYANRIVDLINTEILADVEPLERAQIIGKRIITRSHTEDTLELRLKAQGGAAYAMKLREKRKDIKHIVGDSSIAVILDDSESVWADYLNHLIQLYPFVYWPHQEDLNKTFHARAAPAAMTLSATPNPAAPPAPAESKSSNGTTETTNTPSISKSSRMEMERLAIEAALADDDNEPPASKKRRSPSPGETDVDPVDTEDLPEPKRPKSAEPEQEDKTHESREAPAASPPSEASPPETDPNDSAVPDSQQSTQTLPVEAVTGDAESAADPNAHQPFLQPFGIRHLPANNADTVLDSMMMVLQRLHSEFFNLPEKSKRRQVQLILPRIRSQVLHGRRISFSGVFPQQAKTQLKSGQSSPREAALWGEHVKLARREVSRIESFGAEHVEDFQKGNPERVTHLVTARGSTQKARKALFERGIFVVSKSWLDQSIISWTAQDELPHKVSDLPLFNGAGPRIEPTPTSIWTASDLELDVPAPSSPLSESSNIDLDSLLRDDFSEEGSE